MSKAIIIRLIVVLASLLLASSLTLRCALAAPAPAAPAATEAAKKAGDDPSKDKKKSASEKRRKASPDKKAKASAAKEKETAAAADKAGDDETTSDRPAKNGPLEKLKAEVELLNLERDKIVSQNIIDRETVIRELSEREAATERVEMELEEAELEMKSKAAKIKSALDNELAELRAEKERLVLEAEISKAKADAEISRLKLLQEERRDSLSRITSEIEKKEKAMDLNNYTEQSPVYLRNPLDGKKLTLSDRRIALNGLISSSTADYISQRINYFNNKDSELPIFIVIDNSPGGSVMSGYKILKAMEGSQAPVYVVVKSFAASMAACITTLADKSFAYPNAVVLHHQIAGGAFGNLTQQREFVEEAEEWWRRLAGPVAEKMGIGLDEFIEQMYENASTGDWVEFADKAKDMHWVDHIIEEIHETSLIKNPDATSAGDGAEKPSTYHYGIEVQVDEDGRPFVNLPRLVPYDYYWLYNPDGYFR